MVKYIFQIIVIILGLQCVALANQNIDIALENIDKIRSSDNKKFLELIQNFDEKAQELTESQLHYYQYLQAYSATFKGEFDHASELLKAILSSNANSNLKFRANLTLLNSLAISKNWSEGVRYLETHMNLLSNVSVEEFRQLGQLGVVLFYNLYGQYEKSLQYIKLINTEILDTRNLCLLKGLEIEAFVRSKNSSIVEQKANSAKLLCAKVNEPVMTGFINVYYVQFLIASNNLNEALEIMALEMENIESANYKRLTIEAYSSLALIYINQGKLELAKHYADMALENTNGLEKTKPITDARYVEYKVAEMSQNHTELFSSYKKYIETERAYLDEVSAKAKAFHLAQLQSIQQKNEIELLNKQNKLLNVEHSLVKAQAENNQLIMILLVAIITLLAFFGYRSWMTQRRLRTLAEYDYLTKVYNRGHFMTLAEDTVKLADKAKHTVACIIFDLDKFKNVNDTYGHAVGDWVLKAAVAAVSECIRENDALARLGGEEFIILLPSCDLGAACHVAEKCIETLQLIDTQETGFDFKVTASFGITTSHLSSYNLSSLIADADKALYESKNNGRNQFSVFNDLDK